LPYFAPSLMFFRQNYLAQLTKYDERKINHLFRA
jgi:hypothetical protein